MLFSFSSLIVISLFLFLLISLNYTEDTVLDNSIDYTTQLIEQVNSQIDSYISYMENITILLTGNEQVNEYLFKKKISNEEEERLKSSILTQFNTIVESREDIYNIAIISNNGRYILNDGSDELNTNITLTDLEWFTKTISNSEGTTLSSSHVQNLIDNNYKWVVTLSKNLRNPYTDEASGIFFIDLNYNIISDLCESNSMGEKGYIFILDQEGNIIYHPQQQLLYSGLKTEKIQEVMDSRNNHFVTKESQSKLYTISTSNMTGWTIVGVEHISELMKNRTQTQVIYILIASLLLIAVIIISVIISNAITRPIKILKNSMKEVEQGHFESASIEHIVDNEIGSLSKAFNIMITEIQNLMKKNIYEQKQKRKNELRALQAQINPHFLYNTLDSIIWMVEGNKTKEVVIMTSALAKLLRQSISNENEVMTIEQEISYIQSYLTIQQMRYKDKLEYEIKFQEELYDEEILKLVIQPIIENAIYHGIKYKETKGLLQVLGYSHGDDIVIKVIDNGIGMSEKVIYKIFNEHNANYQSNGVGIYNVQMRLKLHYGNNYGITYESKTGVGTTATITVPKKFIQEKNSDNSGKE